MTYDVHSQIAGCGSILQMSPTFELACARCKKISHQEQAVHVQAACSASDKAAALEGQGEELNQQADTKGADDDVADGIEPTPPPLLPPPLLSPLDATIHADDKILVAGMHVIPKKKKITASMNAALAILAGKSKKEKKKDKDEPKAAKAGNILIAANVVQRCGIASGAPLVFSAPEHIDTYPRQVMANVFSCGGGYDVNDGRGCVGSGG